MINCKKTTQPITVFAKLQITIALIQEVKNLTYLLPKTSTYGLQSITSSLIRD